MIYSTEELNQNELMNKKHKKVCKVYFYNYWMCFHFCFCNLVGIVIGNTSSAIVLKICATTAGIKKYISITKK